MIKVATPSPRPYPSARESKEYDLPVGPSILLKSDLYVGSNFQITYPRQDMETKLSGLSNTFAPPTTAIDDSFARKLTQARWRAVKPVEQPVSTVADCPRRSKKCEMRFESIAAPFPVRQDCGNVSGSRIKLS